MSLRFRAHHGDIAPTKFLYQGGNCKMKFMTIIKVEKYYMWEDYEISEDVMLITFFSILASFITITLTSGF